jgi:hypothetical protein
MNGKLDRKCSIRCGRGSFLAIGSWIAAIAMVLLLFTSAGVAQSDDEGPFEILSGSWSGSGTIALSSGTKERIRCGANYRVVTRTNVQLQITCASDSYKFSLFGNVLSAAGELSGYWSESTRNVTGRIFGRVSGNHVQARAEGPTFSALFAMTTRGNRQSVTIESPGSEMAGVRVTLFRRSR